MSYIALAMFAACIGIVMRHSGRRVQRKSVRIERRYDAEMRAIEALRRRRR